MKSILKRLAGLADDELMSLSEAIDVELESRLNCEEEIPDSARRRAVMREQSYRHVTGARAVPVIINGAPNGRRRMAA